MTIYTQLTREQRYQIKVLLKTEHNQTEIANVIGVDKSTISRELGRNRGRRGYRTQPGARNGKRKAQTKSETAITDETWHLIEEKLRLDWSPEQITGWLEERE